MKVHSVEDVLGPEGALSRVLEGYEHRPEQLSMAREVEKALVDRAYLLAEAGTGTGKTLAYLVPALQSGRKVVVSTATKTLQEQIFFKDLPLLRDKVGLSFEAAYLKGRSNYLCAHRFEAFDLDPIFSARDDASRWPKLRSWAFETTTGDRAELDLPDDFATWARLSTTSETCLGQKCPLYETCFVTRARRLAEAADLVVVNHHLFFADLALRTRSGVDKGLGVLPRYEAVVFDEAHALEDVATDFFGVQVSTYRLDDLAVDAMEALPKEDERSGLVSALALTLRGRAEALAKAASRSLGLKGSEALRLGNEDFSRLSRELSDVDESLSALGTLSASEDEPALQSVRRRAGELAGELEFLRRADSIDHVYWAEARGRGTFFRAAPIEISEELQKRLYSAVDTVVFTSATLTAQGRFDFFASRVGLSGGEQAPTARKVAVASPFDFPRQAALYLPPELPEPNQPGFTEAVAEELVALANLTGGRAFALFTSLRQLDAVYTLAHHRLPFQVLKQGDRPKSALLEEFRMEPSVLFASHSFWEGVDVPGEALSLVVIDRLPFASPGDPLVAARIDQLRARGQEPFSGYQIPQAAIALRQGFGRLIRTRKDRGVVALLDRRITSKAYGRAFLQSLPKARRFSSLEELELWFSAAQLKATARGS